MIFDIHWHAPRERASGALVHGTCSVELGEVTLHGCSLVRIPNGKAALQVPPVKAGGLWIAPAAKARLDEQAGDHLARRGV